MTLTLTPDTVRDVPRTAPSGLVEVKQMRDAELRAELRARLAASPESREAARHAAVDKRSAEAASRLRNLGN